jgi:hypothetical protein
MLQVMIIMAVLMGYLVNFIIVLYFLKIRESPKKCNDVKIVGCGKILFNKNMHHSGCFHTCENPYSM